MWSTSGLFHSFEVGNFREMVCIMTILTTNGTREVFTKIVGVFSLVFVFISPPGGSSSPDSHCPR
jgi:hypothetical protein